MGLRANGVVRYANDRRVILRIKQEYTLIVREDET